MTLLAPFIAPILTAIRWLAITAAPFLMRQAVAHILMKLGIAVVTFGVIMISLNTLIDIIQTEIGNLGSFGVIGPAVNMLNMFGFFNGLSLIISAYLARAGWMVVTPRFVAVSPT